MLTAEDQSARMINTPVGRVPLLSLDDVAKSASAPKLNLRAAAFAVTLGKILVDYELADISEASASAQLVDIGFDFDVAIHLLAHVRTRREARAPLPTA